MRALGGRLLRFVLLRDNRARHVLDAGDHHRLEHLTKPVHSMCGWTGGPSTHLVRSRVRSRAISRLCISKSAKSARADRGGETRSSHDEATAMSRSFTLLFGVVSIAPVASAYVSHGQATTTNTTTTTKTNTNKPLLLIPPPLLPPLSVSRLVRSRRPRRGAGRRSAPCRAPLRCSTCAARTPGVGEGQDEGSVRAV